MRMEEKPDSLLVILKTGHEFSINQEVLNELKCGLTIKNSAAEALSFTEGNISILVSVLVDINLLENDSEKGNLNALKKITNAPFIIITSQNASPDLYAASLELNPINYILKDSAPELIQVQLISSINTSRGISFGESGVEKNELQKYINAIQNSEEQFKQVWEKSIDGMRLVDIEGKTILVNEAFCRLVGKKKEQLEGKDFSEIYNYSIKEIADPAVRRSILQKFKERILADEIEPFFERQLFLWNGKKVWFQLSNAILRRKDGTKVVLSIFRDISETKEYEDKLNRVASELKELNDSKDKFISILSHDLRGPFHGFLGITEVLANDLESFSNEEIKESAEMLNRALKNQYLLLEDLLTWSRIQTKRIDYKLETIKVVNEIYSVIYVLMPNAEAKNVELVCNIADDYEVNCDRGMLKLIFRNLIANAIKFSYNGGKVIINARTNNKGAVLSVSDNGMGISEEDISKLFRTDVHFTMKGTAEESGTGLGLILCKEIVDLHKGKIWVESKKNEGSTFYVFLPSSSEE